ncbi:MAG: hypothetical protein CM15mP58_14340 [Burkholderiaceae bacterium]|nr:MAG: hypothetical protein CM15mP58_14340 [Burkholderiaceae bacterium]
MYRDGTRDAREDEGVTREVVKKALQSHLRLGWV